MRVRIILLILIVLIPKGVGRVEGVVGVEEVVGVEGVVGNTMGYPLFGAERYVAGTLLEIDRVDTPNNPNNHHNPNPPQ